MKENCWKRIVEAEEEQQEDEEEEEKTRERTHIEEQAKYSLLAYYEAFCLK